MAAQLQGKKFDARLYKKGRGLGKGAYGEVFQFNLPPGCKEGPPSIAVKVLLTEDNFKRQVSQQEAAMNGALVKAAGREIEFSKLKHPNIVQFYGYCTIDNKLCLAMEICQESLHHYIQKMKGRNVFGKPQIIPDDQIQAWTAGLVRGLQYLHSQDIIHRDIKPANILLASHARNLYDDYKLVMPKLADFGCSRELDARLAQDAAHMTLLGTPAYMAPEIFSGTYERSVDIYALGVIILEMSNGNLTSFQARRITLNKFNPLEDLVYKMTEMNFKQRLSLKKVSEHRFLVDQFQIRDQARSQAVPGAVRPGMIPAGLASPLTPQQAVPVHTQHVKQTAAGPAFPAAGLASPLAAQQAILVYPPRPVLKSQSSPVAASGAYIRPVGLASPLAVQQSLPVYLPPPKAGDARQVLPAGPIAAQQAFAVYPPQPNAGVARQVLPAGPIAAQQPAIPVPAPRKPQNAALTLQQVSATRKAVEKQLRADVGGLGVAGADARKDRPTFNPQFMPFDVTFGATKGHGEFMIENVKGQLTVTKFNHLNGSKSSQSDLSSNMSLITYLGGPQRLLYVLHQNGSLSSYSLLDGQRQGQVSGPEMSQRYVRSFATSEKYTLLYLGGAVNSRDSEEQDEVELERVLVFQTGLVPKLLFHQRIHDTPDVSLTSRHRQVFLFAADDIFLKAQKGNIEVYRISSDKIKQIGSFDMTPTASQGIQDHDPITILAFYDSLSGSPRQLIAGTHTGAIYVANWPALDNIQSFQLQIPSGATLSSIYFSDKFLFGQICLQDGTPAVSSLTLEGLNGGRQSSIEGITIVCTSASMVVYAERNEDYGDNGKYTYLTAKKPKDLIAMGS